MAGKRHFIIVLFILMASCGFGAPPVTVEVVEVRKIWDQGPHNAFTDLVRWHDTFYCAFREGRGHVSTDGRIRILESKDADRWEPAALISLEGYDLRDAHLSVTPDGRLMLLGGAAPRDKDNQSAPTGTFVSFSKDGRQWTEPQIVVQPGRWLWCVTWHEGKAYGVSYTAGQGDPYLDLLVSDDGIHYKTQVPRLLEQGYPTEVTLRFDSDGTCYAFVRRDRRGDDPSSALLGISRPDYKQWQWKDLGAEFNGFGGPNFIQIPGGIGSTELTEVWLAAGRMHDGGAHTAICYLDVENGVMTRLTKLPSGGDTSYPGMVWHNDMLYVSFYSSHEAKTSIYLAKLKVKATGLRKITGVVRDQEGKPISDAIVLARLDMAGSTITNDTGRFTLMCRSIDTLRPKEDTAYLVVRHKERNLAATVELDDNTMTLDIRLTPGVIFSGKVVDIDGKGIPEADLFVTFRVSHLGVGCREVTDIDPQGNYEIRAVPSGQLLSVSASAEGYGEQYVQAHTAEAADGRIELKSLVLPIANLSVSGVVVDVDNKPVDGARVSCYGEGQPSLTTRTNADGKFMLGCICAGRIGIRAQKSGQKQLHGRVETESGAAGVRIVLQELDAGGRPVPKKAPSQVGRTISELDGIEIDFIPEQVKNRMILVCFWDMNQRPSRNFVIQLAKRAERLKEKGVSVVTVQASNVDENKLNEWVKEYNIPFPVGMIQEDEEKTCFNWGVKSLPWLILTNSKHVVAAEGFGLDELDGKIGQTGDGKR